MTDKSNVNSFRSMCSSIISDINSHSKRGIHKKFLSLFFDTSLQLLINYRVRYYFKKTPFSFFNVFLNYFQKVFLHCEISENAIIGQELRFAHPLGIVIGDGVVIGDNAVIFQQVTLGGHGKKKDTERTYPMVENNVTIYAGAKIIGGVTIGEGVVIGANAVVNKTIPSNKVATGIPATYR